MTRVRDAKSPAYRSMSLEVERGGTGLRSPEPRGPLPLRSSSKVMALQTRVPTAISVLLDIGQGAGLSAATGVRPYLPPLVAGALARGDAGVDFEGTDYAFLEKPGFLGAVLGLAVLAYVLERGGRRDAARVLGLVAIGLGALLFAGSLADGDHTSWPGLVAGAGCAALGYVGATGFLDRVRRRLEGGPATLLDVYADLAALVLAGLSILAPPVGYLALAAFVWLLLRGREGEERKYEGLRILR